MAGSLPVTGGSRLRSALPALVMVKDLGLSALVLLTGVALKVRVGGIP